MEHARKQQFPKETITSSDTTALEEFDQKTTLFQTITNSKSFNRSPKQRALYHALMESILEDEDAMDKGKTSKDTEPSKKAKSTESSKGTSKSQPKSFGKSAEAEETVFEAGDTQGPQNQGQDIGNTDDQPNVKAAPKHDWFKKPERPLTLNSDWNVRKIVDFRPPQTWISKIDQAEKPPLSFDELMSTPINFSAYVMNHLKIDNLTQDHLVGPVFNLLKGTCKSCVELEYNIEESYKSIIDRLDWNNPEGKEYSFDLSNPLSLIMEQGRHFIHVDYFINNDLEYLRGGSLSKKYTTSTTKTKAIKYDIPGIEDMYDYGYLEEIEVRREDQQLYKFKEGDFPRLHLHDIEDMLLLLVQKKLSNLERDVIFDLVVALRMFTRRIFILKRVKDLQLGVKSYQKKLNITKPKTFRLMLTDELYKFSDRTLTSVRIVLHDIASNLRMDYLPKKRWSSLDKKRSRIMIKAID
ncbi:hypothetical protein Tco_0528510 [Tanacetum coccineum]